MQIAAGAVGICCAKLGEAEVFADAGVTDIRLPYPLNPANADRVFALADRVTLSFIVDDPAVAREWSDDRRAARAHAERPGQGGRRLPSLRDRSGAQARGGDRRRRSRRCRGCVSSGSSATPGTATAPASEADAEAIAAEEARILRDLAAASQRRAADEISVGATPTARFSVSQTGITEMRPGNYAYFDRTQVGLGAAAWDDCALTVLARVVSRPAADRVILDSGSKTLTTIWRADSARLPGYGAVLAGARRRRRRTNGWWSSGCRRSTRTCAPPAASRRCRPARWSGSSRTTRASCRTWSTRSGWSDGDRVVERLPVAARGRIT